jgi:hypothetical protein
LFDRYYLPNTIFMEIQRSLKSIKVVKEVKK